MAYRIRATNVEGDTVRTYGDLIRLCKPSSLRGTCCACHDWHNPTWQLSTRASICKACCKRKADQVLGSIVTAERKARRWIHGHPKLHTDPKFLASISGTSIEFILAEIAKAKKP